MRAQEITVAIEVSKGLDDGKRAQTTPFKALSDER